MQGSQTGWGGALEVAATSFDLLREVKDYAIYLIDADGVVLTWNDGAQAIKGYTADEIIGHHFSRFFEREDQDAGKPQRLLSIARAEGRVQDQAWRLRKDGTRFWADVVITAIHEKDGRIPGFVKVTRDLTDRRRAGEMLRQSEERLRLLIEGVKDYAIFMLDSQGNILSWNSGAQAISGYSASEVIGRHFSMFYTEELRTAHHPERELEIAREVGRYEEEGLRVRKNGEQYWANVVLTAVYSPGSSELRGYAKVTRDLTERRRAEEAVRTAAQQLDLERLRTEEERAAVRARDEFISVAAHELRTPLSSLLLKIQSAQSMAKQAASGDALALTKLSDRLDGGLRQLRRLSGLVQRLLDVSSIVRGKLALRLNDASMAELLQSVIDDFQEPAAAAASEVTLTVTGRCEGRWDSDRLEQVLANVLSNAIKYGAGRPIDVRADADGERVKVVIADQGIGIATEDLERVFERFERAVSLDNYGGLGLGLYIAKSIVDAHGGSIYVTSEKGRGSAFTIDLPRLPLIES